MVNSSTDSQESDLHDAPQNVADIAAEVAADGQGEVASQSAFVAGSGKSFGERIFAAVSPVIASEGFELLLVDYHPNTRVLCLFVDKKTEHDTKHEIVKANKMTAIGIDDCTKISHLVGDLLDASGLADLVSGAFRLEVSSPGLDRPLVTPAHFCRFSGSRVKVHTRVALGSPQGRRKFTGELQATEADAEGAMTIMLDDGMVQQIKYSQVERANVVPVW